MTNQKTPKPTPFGQRLCQWLLKIAGWRVDPFPSVNKAIVAGGPHTSNWDGVLGLTAKIALGVNAHLMIKEELFKGPLGWLLRKLGALPINRHRAAGVVEQTVEQFACHDPFYIIVTPEGTRTQAAKWKTGFYHIARQAQVAIIVAVADYRQKRILFPLIQHPSGDMEKDMNALYHAFAQVTPRHPEKLSAPVKAIREQQQSSP